MAMSSVRETADSDTSSLVDRAVAGDADALERLLARVHPFIARYCRSRMSGAHRSLSNADDVAQEVCMAVLTALPSYREQGRPFLAFVYGIAAHKVADAHRAAGRSRSISVAEVPDAPSLEPGPEQAAIAGSTSAMLNDLLSRLPDPQPEIVRLRVGVGLSAEEVAEMLDMTAGAVRVAQHRALAKLRVLVARDSGLRKLLG